MRGKERAALDLLDSYERLFKNARRTARRELVRTLGVGPDSLTIRANGTEMNLLGGDQLPNAYLFAVNTVLGEVVSKRGDRSNFDARFQ